MNLQSLIYLKNLDEEIKEKNRKMNNLMITYSSKRFQIMSEESEITLKHEKMYIEFYRKVK
jgi:hypothetical protein